jgi:hypothetical protein
VQARRREPDYVRRWVADERSFWRQVEEAKLRRELAREGGMVIDEWGEYQYSGLSLDEEVAQALKRGRGGDGLSGRSILGLKRRLLELRWEALPRPLLFTLTYPADWGRWCPDGRALERHREAFTKRWRRQWGEPMVGLWSKEFQKVGRPHVHLYLGLPEAVSALEYEGLRERTLLGKRLESSLGKYEGRRNVPAIGGKFGGDFGYWCRVAWTEVVTGGEDRYHAVRGVDARVFFFSDKAEEEADRLKVAEYLATEVGKRYQKQPPDGFGGVGRYWGILGEDRLRQRPEVRELDTLVALEFMRRLERWVAWKRGAAWRRWHPYEDPKARRTEPEVRGPAGALTGMDRRRPFDGLTALGMSREKGLRLLAYSVRAAEHTAAGLTGSWCGPNGGSRGQSPLASAG